MGVATGPAGPAAAGPIFSTKKKKKKKKKKSLANITVLQTCFTPAYILKYSTNLR